MPMSMDSEIQRNLEPLHAHQMLKDLKTLFAQQVEQELFQTTRDFHSCKQEERQSVSSYVLKMKGYIENLECLGHPVTLGLGVRLILIGLRKKYDGFVQNYNMHSMGKTVNELHAMLKLYEQTLTLPKSNTLALHVIRAGKVQKSNKHKKLHSQTAARGHNHGKGKHKQAYAPKPKIPPPPKMENPSKNSICHECGEIGHWKRNCLRASRKLKPEALSLGQNHGKGKHKQAYASKPKIPLPPKMENPSKNSICHECGEIGHWKRNCPQYLAELMKKKKNAASGAGGLASGRARLTCCLSTRRGDNLITKFHIICYWLEELSIFLSGETLKMISSHCVNPSCEDKDFMYWGGSTIGKFSVKSAINFIRNDGDVQNDRKWDLVWKALAFEHIRMFIWLALHDRLPSNLFNELRENYQTTLDAQDVGQRKNLFIAFYVDVNSRLSLGTS
nr:zinc finger, CCHC-type [Tanacetum cinerariifolium]